MLLPDVEDFRPRGTGLSPLATVEEWVNVPCPKCGEPARRETDVSDTFLDFAWYHLRYPSTDFDDVPFDKERTDTWLPVDMYIGGNEHAVRHLLYARFVMRALHDMALVPAAEPYTRFRAHGMIIMDGAKMSKSRGNVLNPDEYIERYGADTVRLFMMYLGPYTLGGDFRDKGIAGMTRFINRTWRATQLATGTDVGDEREGAATPSPHQAGRGRYRRAALQHCHRVPHGVRSRARSRMLGRTARRVDADTLLKLLAPFAPFVTEELWDRTGHEDSVHERGTWPVYDPELATPQRANIAITVDGRRRGEFEVDAGTSEADLSALALAHPRVVELLGGRQPGQGHRRRRPHREYRHGLTSRRIGACSMPSSTQRSPQTSNPNRAYQSTRYACALKTIGGRHNSIARLSSAPEYPGLVLRPGSRRARCGVRRRPR